MAVVGLGLRRLASLSVATSRIVLQATTAAPLNAPSMLTSALPRLQAAAAAWHHSVALPAEQAPAWWQGLAEQASAMWEGFLRAAVPKRRRSLARRRTRHSAQAQKRFQPRQNLALCQACGAPKLMHHLCPHCLRKVLAKPEASSA